MEFTLTQYFPTGLDRLWAAFGHPEYPKQKYFALGATDFRLHRFDVTSDAIEVDLERDVPVDRFRLPSWSAKIIGHKQTLRHRTRWMRVSSTQVMAELDIVPRGLPVGAQGTGTINETEPGTTQMVLIWRLKSKLPMLGEKVERLFAEQIRIALDDDHEFTLQFLQQMSQDCPKYPFEAADR